MRVRKPKGFKHQREVCRKEGCCEPAINGYCSREHAPYGALADAPDDYLVYPVDFDDPPPSKKQIHKVCCSHQHACPFTCRSQRMKIPRSQMTFGDRCLCTCHEIRQHDDFEEYE